MDCKSLQTAFRAEFRGSPEIEESPLEPEKLFQILAELHTSGKQIMLLRLQRTPYTAPARTLEQPLFRRQTYCGGPAYASCCTGTARELKPFLTKP